MKSMTTLLILCFLSCSTLAAQNISHLKFSNDFEIHKNQKRYLVKYRNATSVLADFTTAQTLVNEVQQLNGRVIHRLPSISALSIEVDTHALRELVNHPEIEFIEPDPQRFLAGIHSNSQIMHTLQTHDIPDNNTSNQTVCVIDTGYDGQHEDLPRSANISGETLHTLSDHSNTSDWQTDTYGHGTHVTGTLVALGNAIGIDGIMPSALVNLHHVKVLDEPQTWQLYASDIIAGLEACQKVNANVINISIAGMSASRLEETAMQLADNNGVLLVAAAGNRGNNTYFYPASYDSVISVGAVDMSAVAWRHTQENDQIELVAPGVNITSTLPNNQYGVWNGTSMATPYVAGIAALVWSHYPQCTNKQIRYALQLSAKDLGFKGKDDQYGYGLIQAHTAKQRLNIFGCSDTDKQQIAVTPSKKPFKQYVQKSPFAHAKARYK